VLREPDLRPKPDASDEHSRVPAKV
jgi:hypothetical protein